MSLIGSLDIGKRAIMAQAQAVKVAGQNITNVNIPGYSRQRVELKNVIHASDQKINLLEIHRIRDGFIDKHLRNETQSLGNWDMRSQIYSQIENIFLEPSEYGINNLLSEFWNSWEDLANNPESVTSRAVVVQRGQYLAQAINRIDTQLKGIRESTNGYINDRLTQLNDKASQVAYLNSQITFLEAGGQEASEMRDTRDRLIDQISKLVNVTTIERDNGSVALFIGGRAIVDDETFVALEADNSLIDGMIVATPKWSDDNTEVDITNGEIAGLLYMRDNIIPGLMDEMDQLAGSLIDAVNAIHETGYGLSGTTGVSFFTGSGAHNIAVNSDIVSDVRLVSASGNSEVGDNSIALAIAELSTETVGSLSTSIGRFYSDIVNSFGAESDHADMMRESAEMLITALEEQKESISGVSLDEEMADLIRFQRAYESAAQYMTVVNEMLGVLIDMGR